MATSSITKRARIGSNSCPKCDVDLSECEGVVLCSVCEINFCITCAKVPLEMLAFMNSGASNVLWTCSSCKANFPSMSSMKSAINNLDNKNDERFQKLEDKLGKIDDTIHRKVRQEINEVKTTLTENIKQEVRGILGDQLRDELREIEDQKRRVSNVVCFNFPESKKATPREKKYDDERLFASICNDINIENIEVTSCFRIGKPKEKTNRPLKVMLSDKKQRNEVIKQAKLIKTNCPDELQKCIITKDLTERQRKENKARREQLERDRAKPRGNPTEDEFNNTTIISQPILHSHGMSEHQRPLQPRGVFNRDSPVKFGHPIHAKSRLMSGFGRDSPAKTSTPAQKRNAENPSRIIGDDSVPSTIADEDETVMGGILMYGVGEGLDYQSSDQDEP